MRRGPFLSAAFLLLAATCLAAEERVRNPFWPQGFEGMRYPISAQPRYPTRPDSALEAALLPPTLKPGETLKTVTNSIGRVMQVVESENETNPTDGAARTPQQVEDDQWKTARQLLHHANTLSFEEGGRRRQSVVINGRVYADGDLVSVNSEANRFTWIVRGVTTNGTLRVERLKKRMLSDEELKNNL